MVEDGKNDTFRALKVFELGGGSDSEERSKQAEGTAE